MKKLYAFALFVFSLFLLTSCVAGQKQTSKPTASPEAVVPADWQSYENEKHGLSFKYPGDWQFNTSIDQEDRLVLSVQKEDESQEKILYGPEGAMPLYTFNIFVEGNIENITPKQRYLKYFGEDSQAEAESKLEDFSLSGIQGIKYLEPEAPSSGMATVVVVAHKQKFYQFTYSAFAHQATHEKYLEDFYTLLETVELE